MAAVLVTILASPLLLLMAVCASLVGVDAPRWARSVVSRFRLSEWMPKRFDEMARAGATVEGVRASAVRDFRRSVPIALVAVVAAAFLPYWVAAVAYLGLMPFAWRLMVADVSVFAMRGSCRRFEKDPFQLHHSPAAALLLVADLSGSQRLASRGWLSGMPSVFPCPRDVVAYGLDLSEPPQAFHDYIRAAACAIVLRLPAAAPEAAEAMLRDAHDRVNSHARRRIPCVPAFFLRRARRPG